MYRKISKDSIDYFTLNLLHKPRLVHAFSTRTGGISRGCYQSLNLNLKVGDKADFVEHNRKLFCRALGVSSENLVAMNQKHSDQIMIVKQVFGTCPEVDALITKQAGLMLAVQTADCVPVLVADPINKIIAAVHAGWRGTAANILGKTLRKIVSLGADIKSCLVGIGPCIGPCCYQVDEQVISQLDNNQIPCNLFAEKDGAKHWRLDLAGINQWQAESAGVPAKQISKLDMCTSCLKDQFFSYRRDGETGRMMGVVMLTEKAE